MNAKSRRDQTGTTGSTIFKWGLVTREDRSECGFDSELN